MRVGFTKGIYTFLVVMWSANVLNFPQLLFPFCTLVITKKQVLLPWSISRVQRHGKCQQSAWNTSTASTLLAITRTYLYFHELFPEAVSKISNIDIRWREREADIVTHTLGRLRQDCECEASMSYKANLRGLDIQENELSSQDTISSDIKNIQSNQLIAE